MRERAVRQHDMLFDDVVDGLSVDHRTCAGRVVGHHAADGRAARRRDVRREAQTRPDAARVQLVEHDARLDARPPLRRVHLEQPVEVLRGVDDDAAADGLTRLRSAAAPHRQRAAMTAAGGHRTHDVFARLDHHHAERLDLIHAGIGGIERTGDGVEPHLALDVALELALDRVDVDRGRKGGHPSIHWVLAKSLHGMGAPWTDTICDTFSFSR